MAVTSCYSNLWVAGGFVKYNIAKKIDKGKKLSPVLLVRGNARMGVPLIIADGHHRICASWYWDEDTPVACCIASVPHWR